MAADDQKKRLKEAFSAKQFDVEHALNMYACSHVILPAAGIYEPEFLEQFSEEIEKCHIYIVGIVPKIHYREVIEEGTDIIAKYEVGGIQYQLLWPKPPATTMHIADSGAFYVTDAMGQDTAPSSSTIMNRLSQDVPGFGFKVLYIGQAYGDGGSRSALDRLKKHETLQKISIQGIPNDMDLTILMLEIMPANRLFTMFNPWAENTNQGDSRIDQGLDKLFNTTEAERTTLYEASIIRYFQPDFNKKLKDTFPSTDMKNLRDCYDKDISAITAEICFDDMPFLLFSDTVERRQYHIAHHDLHKEEDRKVFFAKT